MDWPLSNQRMDQRSIIALYGAGLYGVALILPVEVSVNRTLFPNGQHTDHECRPVM